MYPSSIPGYAVTSLTPNITTMFNPPHSYQKLSYTPWHQPVLHSPSLHFPYTSHYSLTPASVVYHPLQHLVSFLCACHSFLRVPVVHPPIYHCVKEFSMNLSLILRTNDFTPSSMLLSIIPPYIITSFNSLCTCHSFSYGLFCYTVLCVTITHYPSAVALFSHALAYHLFFVC